MNILGIETSCDETSSSVVRNGREILSNIVLSQIDIHKKFGGVVPEIACRHHVEAIIPVIDTALSEANLALDDIDAVAVTQGPGLIGALMVGLSAAKGIAFAKNKPLIGVNHIEAHIYANFMQEENIELPCIALIVSGGHTNLFYVKAIGDYEILGQTKDDAAGESFDKVAKLLGLEYPGGPIIDKISKQGNPKAVDFPRSFMGKDSLDFSFSGLKTAVLYYVRDTVSRCHGDTVSWEDIAASFQQAVVDVLVHKACLAADKKGVNTILVGGGVSLNSCLRASFKEKSQYRVIFPSAKLCMDNAGMIAGLGYEMYKQGKISGLDIDAKAVWPIFN